MKKKIARPWLEPPAQKRWYPVTVKGAIDSKKKGEYGFFRIMLSESNILREVLEYNKSKHVRVRFQMPNGEVRSFYCTLNQAPNTSWRLYIPTSQIDAELYQILKNGEYLKAEIKLAEPPPPPPT